jgi:hypothetical protein
VNTRNQDVITNDLHLQTLDPINDWQHNNSWSKGFQDHNNTVHILDHTANQQI